MWLLNFLSENFIHLMVLASVGGLFILPLLHAIPIFTTYKTAAQYILIAILALGIFTEGSMFNDKIWQAKQVNQALKDSRTETMAAEKTIEIVEKVVVQEKIIKEKQDVLIIKVPVYITEKADSECVIPNSAIQLYDHSTQNEVPGTAEPIQEGSSDVTLSEMSTNTIRNNELYYQLKNNYEGLRELYKEQKKIHDDNK